MTLHDIYEGAAYHEEGALRPLQANQDMRPLQGNEDLGLLQTDEVLRSPQDE